MKEVFRYIMYFFLILGWFFSMMVFLMIFS